MLSFTHLNPNCTLKYGVPIPCLTITLSTCILTDANPRVDSNSTGPNCFLPLVKAGILSSALYRPTESATSNPLSASMTSPGLRWSKNPLLSVKCLSDVLPLHHFDIKETVACGVMPIRYFMVWWCLYFEYLWDRKIWMGVNGEKIIIFWSQSLYALDYTYVVCGFKW